MDDAENSFSNSKAKGPLRVEVHGTLARHFLLPKLPGFLQSYPDLELFLSEGDHLSDAVREGLDCVLRVGNVESDDLVAKQVGTLEEVTVASPLYLEKHGKPLNCQDLTDHKMVGFRATGTNTPMPLEFCSEGKIKLQSINLAMSVNSAETLVKAALLGLGIIQVPRYHIEESLQKGTLIPLIEHSPPSPSPIFIMYPKNRKYAARVKVFIDWVEQIF
jgi:DNA-binding transcriptional LysR family regulator